MGFEKFVHKRLKGNKDPRVSITDKGFFRFNKATMSMYVKGYNYIVLLYDKEKSRIGFQLTDEEAKEAYKIGKLSEGTQGYVTGLAFLKFYGVAHDKTHSYKVEWDEDNKMMIINLLKHSKSKS